MNDAKLGKALRTIADHFGHADHFDWYARRIFKMSTQLDGVESPGRVHVTVEHPDRVDGLIEHLVEMTTGKPCGVTSEAAAMGTASADRVELWRLAAEFTNVTPSRIEAMCRHLDLSEAHWSSAGLSPDGADLVRRELRSRGASPNNRTLRVEQPINFTAPDEAFEERMVAMFEKRLSEQVGDSCTLRVHAINREIVESDEVAAGPGLETIVVADDLGRRVPIAAMAWGSGFEVLNRSTWDVTGLERSREDVEPAAISLEPLDASKTYLVIAVEHPEEAIRG